MRVLSVSFFDFRNLDRQTVALDEGVNLFCGQNAQGKTNALEAIWLFTGGRSFRAPSDRDMIKTGSEGAKISLRYFDGERENSLSIEMHYGRGRIYRKNDVPVRTGSEFAGHFRAVLFAPEHIAIVKGGPSERRAFLDAALCQLKPAYLASLQKYGIILSQRNALLKSAENSIPPSFDVSLSVWSAQLAREAAYIASEREEYVSSLSRSALPFFEELSSGREKIVLSYSKRLSEEEYYKKLTSNTAREIAAGSTLYGVHKDDVSITLNGEDARFYASQGQQRSIAFAMKLGEGKLSEEATGASPVYLMDDVLSELDVSRRGVVLSSMKGKQVIVTTCMPGDFSSVEAKKFSVKEGRFEEESR